MRSQKFTSYHFERLYLWDSNDGDYEDYTLKGCDTVQSGGGFTNTASTAKQSTNYGSLWRYGGRAMA